MKIADLVKLHIDDILRFCAITDPSEASRLCDPIYCKDALGVSFAFFVPVPKITADLNKRYWAQVHSVRGISVRITSQWFPKSKPLLQSYLEKRGIPLRADFLDMAQQVRPRTHKSRAQKARYGGYPIGNAQNAFVRNLLGRLGDESLSLDSWNSVLADFKGCCAYCGGRGQMDMDHAIPINKTALGEHRIGNLVPACRPCNARKGPRDYRAFLDQDHGRIAVIQAHMAKHGYVPLRENAAIAAIISEAHAALRDLADFYHRKLRSALSDP